MYGKGLLEGLGITLKHFFEKDITVQYPEERPVLYERFRGCLVFEFEKCIACGLCMRSCPNNVLSMETVKDEKTKKNKLMSYTIDLQYCMFCNYCVEVCPKSCIYFNHDFELSRFNRDEIKIVYIRPEGMMDEAPGGEEPTGSDTEAAAAEAAAAEAKKQKQLTAMTTALLKNPHKVLQKVLEDQEQLDIMAALLEKDPDKAGKIAALMLEDQEKARKVAVAFVNKEKKARAAAPKEDPGEGGAEA